ncbi:hypothetical protein TL16_g03352 [Triparma laevis f. inornata]|uniref:C2 domain-containing protein n=1 Tax=Triparma laevis f. inornata TaxID=1714386 RepID=A0A9W7DZ34_9STRA|nr:hypothetical protein TL16_g03352 [Triparma laevis f. inornata]
MIPAQTSTEWRTFRETSKFRLTIMIESAHIELLHGSGLSEASLDLYVIAYLGTRLNLSSPQTKEEREQTKHKTPTIKQTLHPTWEHTFPFFGLKYDSSLMFIELKSRKLLAENPVLGSFSIPVRELMVRSTGSKLSHFSQCLTSDIAKSVLLLGVQLSPSLPPNLDDSVIPRNLPLPRNERTVSLMSDLTREVGANHEESGRDLAYLTVNCNYSCLLFDCGIARGRGEEGRGRETNEIELCALNRIIAAALVQSGVSV